jgi:nucleotide-binding universal stress UspA family protein
MFGRILVATDLTPATRNSLRVALELARHDEGEVLLVHVIRRIPGLPDRELREFYQRLEREARLQMHELSAPFARERGVEIGCEVVMGQPAHELVRIARTRGVELIVLAHREGGGRAPLGSVSYRVGHLAPCSVLLLKVPTAAGASARRAARTRRLPRARAAR